jgi:hypothetical protein
MLLQRAVGLGMLSLGEFTERMDTALAAKTRGELNAVLIDLPGIRLTGGPEPVAPQYEHRPAPGVARPVSPGSLIRSRASAVTRTGRWQVPPTLLLNNHLSSVTLDFTEAVMATQVVELRMDDNCSSTTLIVPPAATVDLDGLQLLGSSVTNKARTGPPIGLLHLVVHGRLRFSSLTAKQSFTAPWRRLIRGW